MLTAIILYFWHSWAKSLNWWILQWKMDEIHALSEWSCSIEKIQNKAANNKSTHDDAMEWIGLCALWHILHTEKHTQDANDTICFFGWECWNCVTAQQFTKGYFKMMRIITRGLKQWPPLACLLPNQFNRLWSSHTFNRPAASRLAGPFNIRVIINLSSKNLRAFKCHPRHKHLFAKSKNSCHAWSFFSDFCAILARSTHTILLVFRTCCHHRGWFSQLFWGGSAPRPMTRSATLGRAFSLDEAFSGTIDLPYVLFMLLLHISMLSFTLFCAWLSKKDGTRATTHNTGWWQ